MNEYSFTIHGKCPHTGEWNYYQVAVMSHETIRCETLADAANKVRGLELIQEDMSTQLSDLIPGAVRLSGMHCGIGLTTSH